MIKIEYIKDNGKTLLTIIFNKKILDHLNAKLNDNLWFFQSHYRTNLLTLIKSDTGYKIKKMSHKYKCYFISVKHALLNMEEFSLKECIYFLKENRSIKVLIK